MRFQSLLFLLLAGTILGWSACDDEEPMNCETTVPELNYSDGSCTPELYFFTDLLGFPANEGILLSPSCPSANDHGQVVRLVLPPTADDQVALHVYNATFGFASVEVFGSNDCGMTGASLSGCFTTSAVADKLIVSGLNGFSEIFVRLDVAASGPGEAYEEYIPEDGEYIAIAAYGDEPAPRGRVSYQGYNPEFQLEQLLIGCGGPQRVILGSCNPGADIDGWLQEVGLSGSESYTGPGGTVRAADVPPGLDPNTTGTALTKRRPKQNTDDFFAEEDFLLSVPAPGDAGLIDAQDADPNFTEALECLVFELGTGSTEKPGDQILVTVIDGGVDDSGDRVAIFNNHLNRSTDHPLNARFRLGYDFVRGDNFPDDEFGHGTAVAGALVGNYRGDQPLTVIHNKIFSYSSLLDEVFGTYFGAVVATYVAGEVKSNLINMSFGLSPDAEPQALRCAIDYAVSEGATVVTSAGNDMLNLNIRPQWPAVFSRSYSPQVVAVASYNYPVGGFPGDDPVRSDFSNFDPNSVNVAAYLTARTPAYQGAADEFTYLAGTSISAPQVTAAFATGLANATGPDVILFSLPSSPPMFGEVDAGRYLPVCE